MGIGIKAQSRYNNHTSESILLNGDKLCKDSMREKNEGIWPRLAGWSRKGRLNMESNGKKMLRLRFWFVEMYG